MRPKRGGGGGVAPGLMPGGGVRPSSPWRTPTPYLFLGLGVMMGVVAVALLVLLCARRAPGSPPSSRQHEVDGDSKACSSVRVPLRVVVVMAGDALPSFLASAKPLVGLGNAGAAAV